MFLEAKFCQYWLTTLLLLSGDVETNPGPPKNKGPPGGRPKEPTKEEIMAAMKQKVDSYEEKIETLEREVSDQKEDIARLKSIVDGMANFEEEVKTMRAKMDAMADVYDDLQTKMHDVDKTIKNNLLFYGLVPDFTPEIPSMLVQRIQDLFKFNLGISRQIQLQKVSRLTTGPEIRGCRPVLVAFLHFKDREEVLSKTKLLKSSNIYVSEDLSRKIREQRTELFKYIRFIKKKAPNKKCIIRYDKLYVDNDCYVYDEGEGRVVRSLPKAESPYNRSDSRQALRPESSLGNIPFSPLPGLTRAESVHSVNGHPEAYSAGIPSSFGSSENLITAESLNGNEPSNGNNENPQQALPHIEEEQEMVSNGKEETEGK